MDTYDETLIRPKEALHVRHAETEAIFASMGEGAIATDEFGRVVRANPVALKILGCDEADLIGKWFPKVVKALAPDGSDINLIDRPITKAFLTGKPVSEKSRYQLVHGRAIPVHVTVSPIMLNGKPLGAIEVFRDITFEQEVDRMKSEFISLASHQLRTPLSAIKTYSHMLVDGYMGSLSATQKKSLRTIIAASNRMNELISTLLNITRIESGSLKITPKSLHVGALAQNVIKELSLMAADKSIRVAYKLQGEEDPALSTDELMLREILANLVTNAIKYTSDGGSVTVTIKPRVHNVLISVADTGWGIPKSMQKQIFTKFFRAKNVAAKETTGSGLGLYLVKGLVDTLGGDIWFQSEEGKGTVFSFSLPRQFKKKVAPL